MKEKINDEWKSLTELLPANEFDLNVKFDKTTRQVQREAIKEKIKENISKMKIISISGTILEIESIIFDVKNKLSYVNCIHCEYDFPVKISGQAINDKIFKLVT